jgi:hypothetical protein
MRLMRLFCAVGLLLAGICRSAHAQPATQVVTYRVLPINVISFTGTPSLTITTAVAGAAPTTVTLSTPRWNVTTNQTGAKITASIPTNVPTGVTLSVNLATPGGGAVSTGYKALSTVSVDLVTGITKRNITNRVVNYRLAATAAAGVIPSATRVVTYTITGGT